MQPPTPPPQNEKDNSIKTLTAQPDRPLCVTLDLETYLSQLEDWEISEDQKTEFIVTLWNLLLSFAEIGFEIHPAQMASKQGRKSSSKLPETQENTAFHADAVLYSKPYFQTHLRNKPAADIKEQNP